MVDRISKVDSQKYWAIEHKDQSGGDPQDDRDRNSGQRDFDEFSDFTKLIQKNPKNYVYQEIKRDQVDNVFFRSVSTSGHQANLELDIHFADGSVERGIRVAVGRDEGMGYLGKRLGEPIAIEQIFKGQELLSVALFRPLTHPDLLRDNIQAPLNKAWRHIKLYQVQIGILILIIGILLFFLLKILAA